MRFGDIGSERECAQTRLGFFTHRPLEIRSYGPPSLDLVIGLILFVSPQRSYRQVWKTQSRCLLCHDEDLPATRLTFEYFHHFLCEYWEGCVVPPPKRVAVCVCFDVVHGVRLLRKAPISFREIEGWQTRQTRSGTHSHSCGEGAQVDYRVFGCVEKKFQVAKIDRDVGTS